MEKSLYKLIIEGASEYGMVFYVIAENPHVAQIKWNQQWKTWGYTSSAYVLRIELVSIEGQYPATPKTYLLV